MNEMIVFDDLTPLHPNKRLLLEVKKDEVEMRIMDLVTPIGKGQRGLIVAPPAREKLFSFRKLQTVLQKPP